MLDLDIKRSMIHDNIRDNFGRKPRLLSILKTIDRNFVSDCEMQKPSSRTEGKQGQARCSRIFHVRNRAVEILKIFVGLPLSDS